MIDTTDFIFLFRTYSVFGEDALVNVSVEKKEDNDGKLAGYIRIRSKTQGIALSLGDRITSVQRGLPQKQ
jgi:coatomer subunit beta